MPRKHSKVGKRTHKRRQRGGGWGFTGASSIPGTAGIVSNPMVYTNIGDCRAVKPGYDIPTSQYGAYFKGLPGMSGGKRTRKGMKKNKSRKQRGGRYGFFPESIGTVTPNGAAWWAGTYPPVQRIACEGGSFNPLNPTHTGSTEPPGAANPNYYLKGGQRGGAQSLAPATYGVGNVDSMYYYAPTAGYANTASTWRDSVGAPVQIQVPFAARSMNQACLTTGGSPPLTGALQKGGKRSRKAKRGGGFLNYIPGKNYLARIPGLGGLLGTTAPVNTNTNVANLGTAYNALNRNRNRNIRPEPAPQENVGNQGTNTGFLNINTITQKEVVPQENMGNQGTTTITQNEFIGPATIPEEMTITQKELVENANSTNNNTNTTLENMRNKNRMNNGIVFGGKRHKKSKSRKHRGRKH